MKELDSVHPNSGRSPHTKLTEAWLWTKLTWTWILWDNCLNQVLFPQLYPVKIFHLEVWPKMPGGVGLRKSVAEWASSEGGFQSRLYLSFSMHGLIIMSAAYFERLRFKGNLFGRLVKTSQEVLCEHDTVGGLVYTWTSTSHGWHIGAWGRGSAARLEKRKQEFVGFKTSAKGIIFASVL